MEKLINLLNEYEKEVKKSEFYEWEKWIGSATNLFRRDTRDDEGSHIYSTTADTYVISKKYGFIKWLVENRKIDKKKIRCPIIHYKIEEDRDGWIRYCDLDFANEIDSLLMQLSISDTPIEDLILYLK